MMMYDERGYAYCAASMAESIGLPVSEMGCSGIVRRTELPVTRPHVIIY